MPSDPVTPEVEEGTASRGSEVLRFFKELPVLIALALGIALLIKAFVVQAFYIEMQSMEPTLHPSERVLVSKFSYRFGDPERGDIIIFSDPRGPCAEGSDEECDLSMGERLLDWFGEVFGLPTGSRHDLVKRIVAVPGETVAMQDGKVYVCDEPSCQPLENAEANLVEFPSTADSGPQTDDDELEPVTVGADHYYVLGDNRAESADSRSFGVIPRGSIAGRAFVVIWPPGSFRGL